jgi:hypothetical protein
LSCSSQADPGKQPGYWISGKRRAVQEGPVLPHQYLRAGSATPKDQNADEDPIQTEFTISGTVSFADFDPVPVEGKILVLLASSYDEEDLRNPIKEFSLDIEAAATENFPYSLTGIASGQYASPALSPGIWSYSRLPLRSPKTPSIPKHSS